MTQKNHQQKKSMLEILDVIFATSKKIEKNYQLRTYIHTYIHTRIQVLKPTVLNPVIENLTGC